MLENQRGIIVRSEQTSTEQAFTPEGNFKHWKSVVGLPESFPELSPIGRNLGLFHAGNVHREAIREMLVPSPLKVAVVRGQGCTTLSSYVHNVLERHSLEYRMIPILIQNFEHLDDLEDKIRYGIANFLATRPVWLRVGKRAYASGLGGNDGRQCEELQENLNADVTALQFKRDPDQDWAITKDDANFLMPRLEDPLSNPIFRKLTEEDQFILKFVFDFSPPHTGEENEYDDPVESRTWSLHIGRYMIAKKRFEEFKKMHPGLPVREIYFSDPYTLEKIFPGDQRVGWDIKYPPYSPADVFAILAKQYRPEAGHLTTVIDPQLLERLVKPDRPLAQIIDEFGRDLKQRMQSFDSIPYRIHS